MRHVRVAAFAVVLIAAAIYAPTDRAPGQPRVDGCVTHIRVPELLDDCRKAVSRHGEARMHDCGLARRYDRAALAACLNRP